MTCYNCGAVTEPAQKFCEKCGARTSSEPGGAQQTMADDMPPPSFAGPPGDSAGPEGKWWGGSPGRAANEQPGSGGPAGNGQPVASPPTTAGPPKTLPGSPIRLGDGEQVLREYRAVQLRSRKRGEGTLYVTDARIVFFARAQGRGTQRASSLVQQTRLQDISGLQAFVSRRTSILLIVFATLTGFAALGALVTGALVQFVLFLIITVGCVAAIFAGAAERGRAGVKIHCRQSDSAIGFGTFENHRSWLETALSLLILPLLLFLRAQTAFDVMLGRPGQDSDRLISELGALILDLQTRGQLAADYWAAAPAGGTGARSHAAT